MKFLSSAVLLSIFSLVSLSQNVSVEAPQSISWLGATNAKSSVAKSNELTILFELGQPENAQFLYTKNAKNASVVDVALVNPKYKIDVVVQKDFSMIGQQCSCYWLSAKEQLKSLKLPSSLEYKIVFRNSEESISSGDFGFSWGVTYKEGEINGTFPFKNVTDKGDDKTNKTDLTNNLKNNKLPPITDAQGSAAQSITSGILGLIVSLLSFTLLN